MTFPANHGQTPAANDKEENERGGQTQQGRQHKLQGPIGRNKTQFEQGGQHANSTQRDLC